MTTALARRSAPAGTAGPSVRAVGPRCDPRSPKVLVGLIIAGHLRAPGPHRAAGRPYEPSASLSTTNGVPQPPSAAHWLGTTQIQQDVLSQLLVGGPQHDPGRRCWPGGRHRAVRADRGDRRLLRRRWADDLLSMLANFFLVLPALPLLIVIFGFLPQGGTRTTC